MILTHSLVNKIQMIYVNEYETDMKFRLKGSHNCFLLKLESQ